MRWVDQEHLERMERLKKEQEEKAQQDAEVELVQWTLEAEVARGEESPPQDENNKALNYYDDVDRDTEMVSSQETVPASSQESRSTAFTSSQESMSQGTTSISSQESTTGNTILDAAGRTPMEDETCLNGPNMKCTP